MVSIIMVENASKNIKETMLFMRAGGTGGPHMPHRELNFLPYSTFIALVFLHVSWKCRDTDQML